MRLIVSGTVAMVGLAFLLATAGCKKNAEQLASDPQDPASANMAPVSGPVARTAQPQRVLGQNNSATPYEEGEQYPDSGGYADQAPPALPDYAQPVATRPNTIWTPGYWQHSAQGYYWVPGAWVAPPYVGGLWTPPYWAADGPRYRFHPGYWGRHVGFYGGVPYGGGYAGTGYRGGYWRGDRFYYNRAVNRLDVNVIHDYYDRPEPGYTGVRISYNGGHGGISLLPIAAELIAMREVHERPIRYQYELERRSMVNRGQFFGFNQGRPEMVFAPEGYVVEREAPAAIVERVGPGRGNAYGHYKGHEDNGLHLGEFKDHGKDKDKDKGNGHGNGHGRGDDGDDHGRGHGEGHGHDK